MGITNRMDNDYMISQVQDLPTGGHLTRTFNFASETVTTLYERVYRYGEGVSLASQLDIKKFSELDSQAEVDLMRAELERQGGHPPSPSNAINKPRVTGASGLSQ